MLEYMIFWIKPEFSTHYFYRSGIMFRFLVECEDSNNDDLQLQFDYVTRKFPVQDVIWLLQREFPQFQWEVEGNSIHGSLRGKQISMYVSSRQLYVSTEDYQLVDQVLFQTLKKYDSSFFVIEKQTNNYGWVAPIKQRKLALSTQLLYSLL
ncbi:sporulation inhibitor of replication protein SirA [Radiobacillus kanasensis]|uniref:sporulation inhibitor of replication protein SirA n=1 Tax=Radiobacillus kanasensis TaxID=2844358 RepID=UPI001E2E780E|nr:sporulation inhibitor of replication protein SirA [Radiobacillus kanasensis]UFU01131.1 sporulation inhibitor of replication protein SirA [Radiobacillus kanasensis]